MNDPDRTRQREHWQAIAEQLGLAPEPEEPSAPPPKPAPAPAAAEEEQRSSARPEPAVPPPDLEEQAPEGPPRRGRRGRSAQGSKKPARTDASGQAREEQSGGQELEPAPARSGEEEPRRGRRRRSTRSSAAAPSEAAEVEAPGEEAASKPADRSRGRGRGRGSPKKAQAGKSGATPAREESPQQGARAPQATEEEELEDVRSLANWNVPSWNELIASLYRPER